MDDRWESEVIEYGAINITGFRIVDATRRHVKEFLDGWRRLDPTTSLGAGRESISVRIIVHDLPSTIFDPELTSELESACNRSALLEIYNERNTYLLLLLRMGLSFRKLCQKRDRRKRH